MTTTLTLKARERLENALGEVEMAQRYLEKARAAAWKTAALRDVAPPDWMALHAKGSLMNATHAVQKAIDETETAYAHMDELCRAEHGDD